MGEAAQIAASDLRLPQLRFPGFEGEWEEHQLIDLAIGCFSNGIFNDPEKVGRGYRLVNVKDMYSGDGIDIDALTRVAISTEAFERNNVKYGDIFFTRSSLVKDGIAYSNVMLSDASDVTYDGHLIRLRPDQGLIYPVFFARLLKTDDARRQFVARGKTGTMTTIGQDDLASVQVRVPALPEQQKIASFLGAVDAKLDKLRRKKELLEQYKRGLMQKIFAQEIRFTRDDGTAFPDWEEKRLGEVFEFIKTNSFSRNELTYEAGEVKNIHYGDIHTKFSTQFRVEEESVPYLTNNHYTSSIGDEEFCRTGDLVIADASEDYADIGKTIEIMSVPPRSLVAGLHTYVARSRDAQFCLGFASFLMQAPRTRAEIMRIAQGISVLGVSKKNLAKISLSIPSFGEQQKIAGALGALDHKIETVTRKIDTMTQFKKGLLQQMFL